MGERSVDEEWLAPALEVESRADKRLRCRLPASCCLLVTATALAVTGDLTQPAGTAGCVSEIGVRALRRRPRARRPAPG